MSNVFVLDGGPGDRVLAHREDAAVLEGRAEKPPGSSAAHHRPAHPDFADDVARALASLGSFHAAGFPYENLLAGHGRPILGRARQRAEALLETGL